MSSKLSKKQMINDINIFFLKQGKVCEGNIYKISKTKLWQIIVDNDIPHIDSKLLQLEIEETEKFNYYLEIIYHNFMKYKNISIEIIKNIHLDSSLKSNDLEKIIIENNLKYDNDIKDFKELISKLVQSINNYYIAINHTNKMPIKSIPDVINELSLISSI